jgi:hypothetical protein
LFAAFFDFLIFLAIGAPPNCDCGIADRAECDSRWPNSNRETTKRPVKP